MVKAIFGKSYGQLFFYCGVFGVAPVKLGKRRTGAFYVSYDCGLRDDVLVHKFDIYKNARLYTFNIRHGHISLLPTLQIQSLTTLG
jgi:hypothetical protein